MSVNWSWTKRIPRSRASAIVSAPSTSSRTTTGDVASSLTAAVFRCCAWRTNQSFRAGCAQDIVADDLREGCGAPSILFILHKPEREREREAELGIRQAPARGLLD